MKVRQVAELVKEILEQNKENAVKRYDYYKSLESLKEE